MKVMGYLRQNLKLLAGFLLVAGIFLIRTQIESIQLFLSSAGIDTKPQLTIFVSSPDKPLTDFWRFLAQGGEEPGPMLGPTLPSLNQLKPKYIRLDHIFDAYSLVSQSSNGRLVLNWSQLDQAVDDILAVKAKPVLVLSYYPAFMTQDGTVTGEIKDWSDWRFLVSQTVKHFSAERGLKGVIYEVWNEPDLFGGFTIGGRKDYRRLYKETIRALPPRESTQPYLIGGPAITHANYAYLRRFLEYVRKEDLRLDFISYHAYHNQASKFVDELVKVRQLTNKAGLSRPIFITEWGIDGGLNSDYDTVAGYNHLIRSVTALAPYTLPDDKFFVFEVKDGPPPRKDQVFWGRWGLFTHESTGLRPKPRWQALKRLTELPWERLLLVDFKKPLSGLMTSNQDKSRLGLILVNNSARLIQPQLNLRFIKNGQWQVTKWQGFSYQDVNTYVVNNHGLNFMLNLLPRSNALIKLEQIDDLTRSAGRFGYQGDYALNLSQGWRVELDKVAVKPSFGCRFWFKYDRLPQTQTPMLSFTTSTGRQLVELGWGYDGFDFGLNLKTGSAESQSFISADEIKAGQWYPVSCLVKEEGLNFRVRFDLIGRRIETITVMPSGKRGVLFNFAKDWRLNLDDLAFYDPDIKLVVGNNEPFSYQPQTDKVWRYYNFDVKFD